VWAGVCASGRQGANQKFCAAAKEIYAVLPMCRLSHLNALRAFEAAARHGSYVRAAGELGVTPAAVGQQVRALEAWLGAPLFHRGTSGTARLVPTAEAQACLPELQGGFDRIEAALGRLRDRKAQNLVTLTASPAFAAKWLLPRIHGFQATAPSLDLRLDVTDRLVDLQAGDADLGIRYGGGRWAGLASTLLLREEVFPVCSPALLQGRHPLRTPAGLRHHILLHDATIPDGAGYPSWAAWLAAAGVTGMDTSRGLRINASAAVTEAAVAGQGVALGRSVIVADDLAAGRLVRPFAPMPCLIGWAYYVVHTQDAPGQAKVAAFRAWLLKEAGQAS